MSKLSSKGYFTSESAKIIERYSEGMGTNLLRVLLMRNVGDEQTTWSGNTKSKSGRSDENLEQISASSDVGSFRSVLVGALEGLAGYRTKQYYSFLDESGSDDDLESDGSLLSHGGAALVSSRLDFMTNFELQIRESEFEFGFSAPADRYLSESIEKYGVLAREWLNEFFLKSFDRPDMVCSILRVVAHFDYHSMYPQGVTMAIAALRHKDASVRECGIRCFENWEQPSCLTILRNLEIDEGWLKEYLLEVISDLEEIEGHVIFG